MESGILTNGVHADSRVPPLNAHPGPPNAHPGTHKNGSGGWIVQKFGGTSIGKFAVNIAEEIVRYVGFVAVGSSLTMHTDS